MITILGAGGYIGSNIVQFLQTNKTTYYAPGRDEILDNNRDLGDIIYCIGLTADFRSKPFETVEAHVGKLAEVLKHCTFNSLTYLSSARVYINCNATEVTEEAIIPVNPLDPSELYTLTKLTGERLCLSSGKKVRIVRLSNVYGNDNASDSFLADVLKKITAARSVSFSLLPASAKDYIHIEDVVRLLVKIAVDGKDTIYNLASGFNTSNEAIIENLSKHFSFSVDLSQAKKAVIFPLLNIEKIKKEFNYSPGNIITFIPHLIKSFYNVSN
jgi:nucleoside-diphosphate-sugar epimerase